MENSHGRATKHRTLRRPSCNSGYQIKQPWSIWSDALQSAVRSLTAPFPHAPLMSAVASSSHHQMQKPPLNSLKLFCQLSQEDTEKESPNPEICKSSLPQRVFRISMGLKVCWWLPSCLVTSLLLGGIGVLELVGWARFSQHPT